MTRLQEMRNRIESQADYETAMRASECLEEAFEFLTFVHSRPTQALSERRKVDLQNLLNKMRYELEV